MAPTETFISRMADHPAYAHVLRLSYRNSIPSGSPSTGSRQSTSTIGTTLTTDTASTTSTVITSPSNVESGPRSPSLPVLTPLSSVTSAPRSPSARSFAMSSTAKPAKDKKKPSFLGMLFIKEPSTDAFLHMQNQSQKQTAQKPGRMNPPGMSGVSSTKMPQDVPKVNSKWDGMPPRANEEYDRRNSRTSSRGHSTRASSTRSGSAGPSGRGRHSRGLSASTNNSNHSSQASSNSIKNSRAKSTPMHTPSLRSPSGSSLPHITCFFPDDMPKSLVIPHISGLQSRTEASLQGSSEGDTFKEIPRWEGNYAISDQASSPSSTTLDHWLIPPSSESLSLPHQRQPVTKVDDSFRFPPIDVNVPELVLLSLNLDGLDHPITTMEASNESTRVSSAGEARSVQLSNDDARSLTPKSILKKGTRGQVFAPSIQIQHDLEKRPDSSRARLGLMASIIRSPDAVPWECDDEKEPRPVPSHRTSSHKNLLPKSLGIFGKA
ncbi:hypothetical protein GJ744_008521 [Endocarpon pusillum]|uniref:Uncharacterized protein n=1 Tax=Endocarpon pusillum TaxID=364733 RepID=A0A8H7AGZ7_9EURO|nr:hypothetical protein GJ744_008521 [Endocarpon pusillum]